MAYPSTVFVGIKGGVVAVDRSTGTILWNTGLSGSDFVNVSMTETEVFATTRGELFCLDATTGQIRWHNPLKGLGRGIATIAVHGGTADSVAAGRRKRQQDEAAAAAAAAC
jgi:outer membrane protein assembly factor BamB